MIHDEEFTAAHTRSAGGGSELSGISVCPVVHELSCGEMSGD